MIILRVSVLIATKPKAKNNFPYSRHVFTFHEIIILLTFKLFSYIIFLILKYGDWCYILLSGSCVPYLVGAYRRKLKHGVGVSSSGVYLCQNTLKLVKTNMHAHTHTHTHAHAPRRSVDFKRSLFDFSSGSKVV